MAFAFDAAAMGTFRGLALLASHPENADSVRQEIADQAGSFYLPYLRATVLKSLRLWPATPLVLRESTAPTEWESGEMPTGTATVIFAPFYHRDDQRLPFANQFAPQLAGWEGAHKAGRLSRSAQGPQRAQDVNWCFCFRLQCFPPCSWIRSGN
jgi:hypothetical protein